MKRYLRGASDETLEETYGYFSKRMPRLPYPAVEAVTTALEMMADQFPQASSVDRKKSSMRHSLSSRRWKIGAAYPLGSDQGAPYCRVCSFNM